MTSVEEIVLAIEALPLADRLRVVERVVHDVSSAVQASNTVEEQATLIERGGFLVVSGIDSAPLDVFDHRADRDERIRRSAGVR